MSVVPHYFEDMIALRTADLPTPQGAKRRAELLNNRVLRECYSSPGQLAVTSNGAVIEMLACERVTLPYPRQNPADPSHWQHAARGQVNLGRTSDGDLWAFMKHGVIFQSSDSGRSWIWSVGSSATEGDDYTATILSDDTFLTVGSTDNGRVQILHRSQDRGCTWERLATIPVPSPYVTAGDDTSGMTQLLDGTILFTNQSTTGPDLPEKDAAPCCIAQPMVV